MELSDAQGMKIKVGSKVAILRYWDSDMPGKIGEVRGITERCACLHNKPGIRVADGPVEIPNWSVWIKPQDIVVLP